MSFTTPHLSDNPRVQRIASSLMVAKRFEGEGRIIHESYDKAAYIKRRHGFFGSHPQFKTLPTLLPRILQEADEVFHLQDDELSVQKVRSRELACEFEILLPLPTSTNTTSIDDFKSTGTKEWTKEPGHPTHFRPSPSPEPTLRNRASPVPQSSAMSVAGPVSRGETSPRQHPQTVVAGADPETIHQQTSTTNATPTLSMDNVTNINAKLMESSKPKAMGTPTGLLNAPWDRTTCQKIWNDLGAPRGSLTVEDAPEQYKPFLYNIRKSQQAAQEATQEATQQSPPTFPHERPSMSVSAVKGRGIRVPVKSQSKGKKRAATEDPEEAEEDDAKEGETPVKPTKRTSHPAKKPRVTVTAGEDPVPAPKIRQRKPAAKKPRSAAPAAAPEPKSSEAQGSESTPGPHAGGKSPPKPTGALPNHNEYPEIVSGNELPKNKKEAKEAAVIRKQALLVQFEDENRNDPNRSDHPDLGPEFFDTANFTDAERDEPTRCVCGKTSNYYGDWIGCDNKECNVWQHTGCMLAAQKKMKKNAKYLCQQCDPWAHRLQIQSLRKAHPTLKPIMPADE